MSAKPTKKRPKVRYVAEGGRVYSAAHFGPLWRQMDPFADLTGNYGSPKSKAKRIAAALNVYEARRRGELT